MSPSPMPVMSPWTSTSAVSSSESLWSGVSPLLAHRPTSRARPRARLGAPMRRTWPTHHLHKEPDVPDTVFLPDRIEVTRPIPASTSAIFDILRSPEGHVAIDASGMLQDFTGDPAEKVGDTFVIHMDRESLNDFPLGKYDVT